MNQSIKKNIEMTLLKIILQTHSNLKFNLVLYSMYPVIVLTLLISYPN